MDTDRQTRIIKKILTFLSATKTMKDHLWIQCTLVGVLNWAQKRKVMGKNLKENAEVFVAQFKSYNQ